MTLIPNENILREAMGNAPTRVRSFIVSPAFTEAFDTIRTKHKLHFDEAGKIGDSLSAVFLEIVPSDQFPDLLKEALEQNSGKFGAVLADINEQVFKPFRAQLEQASKKSEKEDGRPVPESATILHISEPAAAVTAQPVPFFEKKTSEKAESVAVDAFTEETASAPRQDTQYRSGVDPYREPVD